MVAETRNLKPMCEYRDAQLIAHIANIPRNRKEPFDWISWIQRLPLIVIGIGLPLAACNTYGWEKIGQFLLSLI